MLEISLYISLVRLTQQVITAEQLAAEVRQLMNDLGEQQFGNAIAALDDARISSDPRHELTNAINHLQDAVAASKKHTGRSATQSPRRLRGWRSALSLDPGSSWIQGITLAG